MRNKIVASILVVVFIIVIGLAFNAQVEIVRTQQELRNEQMLSNLKLDLYFGFLNEVANNQNKLFNEQIIPLHQALISLNTRLLLTQQAIQKPSFEYLDAISVRIETIVTDGLWQGTGVIIKQDTDTYILTNSHVINYGKPSIGIYVTEPTEDYYAEVIKVHDEVDLALIKVKGIIPNKQAVRGIAVPKSGDKVYAVGYYLGSKTYGEGVFAGYRDRDAIAQLPILYGSSGTGIVNSRGELIGVAWAIRAVGYQFVPTHAIMVDISDIAEFIKEIVGEK